MDSRFLAQLERLLALYVYGSASSAPQLIGDIVSLFMSRGASPTKGIWLGLRAILGYPAGKNSAGKE
jgi:hypothetical protein